MNNIFMDHHWGLGCVLISALLVLHDYEKSKLLDLLCQAQDIHVHLVTPTQIIVMKVKRK